MIQQVQVGPGIYLLKVLRCALSLTHWFLWPPSWFEGMIISSMVLLVLKIDWCQKHNSLLLCRGRNWGTERVSNGPRPPMLSGREPHPGSIPSTLKPHPIFSSSLLCQILPSSCVLHLYCISTKNFPNVLIISHLILFFTTDILQKSLSLPRDAYWLY